MNLPKKNNKHAQDFSPLSRGSHLAVCFGIIDLGLEKSKWNSTLSPKMMLCFEVQDEMVHFEGNLVPKLVTAKVTISTHEKSTLRAWLDAWVGTENKDFEGDWNIEDHCLGRPCILTIANDKLPDGRTFDRVTNVSALLPQMTAASPYNRLVCFSFPDYEPASLDQTTIKATIYEAQSLPEIFGIRRKVMESDTYKQFVEACESDIDDCLRKM